MSRLTGELFWGTWSLNEHFNDRDGFMIDGYGVIRELSEHRFNSLSVHHNYRELGPEKKLSMQYWKEAALTPEWLDAHGLLYAPGWFQKADGGPVERQVFDYTRDYLGYKLELRRLTLTGEAVSGGRIHARLELVNYGFSVPFGMEESGLCPAGQRGRADFRNTGRRPPDLAQPESRGLWRRPPADPYGGSVYPSAGGKRNLHSGVLSAQFHGNRRPDGQHRAVCTRPYAFMRGAGYLMSAERPINAAASGRIQ